MLRTKTSKQKKKKDTEVEQFLRQIVKTQRYTERRRDTRIDTAIPVAVIPMVDNVPDPNRGFVTFTKNISSDGISLVVNKPVEDDEILIGFPGTPPSFVSATILHRDPLPLGCLKLGLRMHKMVNPVGYPGLEKFLH